MNLEERAKRLYELFYPCLSLTDCIPVAKYVESAIRQGQIEIVKEILQNTGHTLAEPYCDEDVIIRDRNYIKQKLSELEAKCK